MAYLKNCWYMAAWANEVQETPLGRKFLGQSVALFRDSRGVVNAVTDRCPHRLVPLSLGRVRGDSLECGYHGLCFDGNGACTSNPHGPILSGLRVQSFPVAEAHRAIWIWMGERELADPSKIPALDFLGSAPDTAFSQGYLGASGHYELFVDNILDLSHTDYLHPTTLGGGSISRTRAKVTDVDDDVIVRWEVSNESPWPAARARLPEGTQLIDNFTEVHWMAPAVMSLRTATVPAGQGFEGAGTMTNVHIMTPETPTTTHYFYASTRNFALDDGVMNERIATMRTAIFSTEDEPMIRAQQGVIGDHDFWDMSPQLLRIDEGPVRVRRKLKALIEAEAATEPT